MTWQVYPVSCETTKGIWTAVRETVEIHFYPTGPTEQAVNKSSRSMTFEVVMVNLLAEIG